MLMPILSPIMRAILGARVGGSAPFDIASTNPSAYYDRTNLATLFQNHIGTTPVTAAGQPVVLVLDKSQGLVREHKPIVGWVKTQGDGVVTVVGSLITITGATTPTYVSPASHVLRPGLTKLKVMYTNTSGATSPLVWCCGSPVTPVSGVSITNQQATTNSDIDRVQIASGSATFLIEEYSELQGNHAYQTTTGKRPITAGTPIYADFDGVDDELVTTFPSSLGAGCTVCRSLPGTGASITTGVTIGTTYTDNVDAHALLIYTAAQWAALDAGKIAKITAWLNAKAGL